MDFNIAFIDVNLPSEQYHLKIADESVCALDSHASEITALKLGTTEITLVDANMKPKVGVKPRSAHLYVVEPNSLQFSIDRGNLWYLQLGEDYRVEVRLVDALGNQMHIADNANFETRISEKHFTVLDRTKNGTQFHVNATRNGKLSVLSKFDAMVDKVRPRNANFS